LSEIKTLYELVAPTMVLHYDSPAGSAGPAETQPGLEALKHFVSHLRPTFPDSHFPVEFQVAEGDLVVTGGTARGTDQGKYWDSMFEEISPTAKQLSWTETAIDRIVEGKIRENWITEDAVGRLHQIGALPTSGHTS
jgi:predicted ester cyclase